MPLQKKAETTCRKKFRIIIFLMSFDEGAVSTCTTFFNFMQNSKTNAKFDAFASSQLNKNIGTVVEQQNIENLSKVAKTTLFVFSQIQKNCHHFTHKKKFFFTQKTEKREKEN